MIELTFVECTEATPQPVQVERFFVIFDLIHCVFVGEQETANADQRQAYGCEQLGPAGHCAAPVMSSGSRVRPFMTR